MPIPILFGAAAVTTTGTVLTPLITFLLSSLGIISVGGITALTMRNNSPRDNNTATQETALDLSRNTLAATTGAAETFVETLTQSIQVTIQETETTQTHLNTENTRLENQNTAMQAEISRLNTEVTTLAATNQIANERITSFSNASERLMAQTTSVQTHLSEAVHALHDAEGDLVESTEAINHLRNTETENRQCYQSVLLELRRALENINVYPSLRQENERLKQALRASLTQNQAAMQTIRNYDFVFRSILQTQNQQNLPGETSHDERRNNAP